MASRAEWKSESRHILSGLRRITERKAAADAIRVPFERLTTDWGDSINVHSQLFYVDQNGKQFPKFPVTADAWRAVVRAYSQWHDITSLAGLNDMWCDLVDAFLRCPDFDEQVDPAFRAWLYGNMCKFTLLSRRTKPQEYDPSAPGF